MIRMFAASFIVGMVIVCIFAWVDVPTISKHYGGPIVPAFVSVVGLFFGAVLVMAIGYWTR